MNKKKEITIIHSPQGDLINLRDAKIAWDEINKLMDSDERFQKLIKDITNKMEMWQKKTPKTTK
jgi:hypothetical protein